MRIIAGEFRGRKLDAPRGDGTRPTTDRVRESLMSAVFSQRGGFEDAVVLDAFAGSGALGLEALSRGAARAVFYECAPEAAKVVQRNVANLGLEPARATVTRADVIERAPQFARPPFDLIFLDPPYEAGLLEPALAHIARFDILAPHGIIVAEHPAGRTTPALAPPYRIHRTYRYGKIALTVYHRDANQVSEEKIP